MTLGYSMTKFSASLYGMFVKIVQHMISIIVKFGSMGIILPDAQ